MTTKMIPIHLIRRDGGTQSRAAINQDVVAEYAELMSETAGANPLPAVRVVFDGGAYWLWDGFHRIDAAVQVGWRDIETEIRSGTRRDAVLLSCGANADHGLRRSNADKRRAVETLLRDNEWGKWSDREISRRCGVDHAFVGKFRKELSGDGHQIERTTTRGGTVYTMKTPGRPGKPLEELERPCGDDGETGISSESAAGVTAPPEVTSSTTTPAHRPRMADAEMASQASFVRPELVGGSFGRVYLEIYQMIGGWRKTNWAGIDRESAAHHLQVLLDLINLKE
jgi:hypothetical protein